MTAAILGTGSFGTALGALLAENLEKIVLIGRDAEVVAHINNHHRNPKYLNEFTLPPQIYASTEIAELTRHSLILFTLPTSATREFIRSQIPFSLPKDTILLSCAKGIERGSGLRMSSIIREFFPENPISVLSGPNHAEELAQKLPAATVIGSENSEVAKKLQELFTTPWFRPYTSSDVAGIELGGAIKNVYALASGIAHGLELGENATSALITRALAEMIRLGTALGGQAETFTGLSGVGDLIVTCFSKHSRNFRVGHALGRGKELNFILNNLGMVAEGVPNTKSLYEAASVIDIRTPIIDAVHAILYKNMPAKSALTALLNRETRPEND